MEGSELVRDGQDTAPIKISLNAAAAAAAAAGPSGSAATTAADGKQSSRPAVAAVPLFGDDDGKLMH